MIQSLQRLLFDDIGDLRPLRRPSLRRKLSGEDRARRQKRREQLENAQLLLFGPRRKKQRYKPPRHLFPWRIGSHDREPTAREQSIAAIFISERAALVRRGWTSNKERKANHFPINPLVFQPLAADSLNLDIDFRDRFE